MALSFQTTLAYTAAAANNISASQSPGAGAILINGSLATAGVATLDAARRVLITSGGNDSGITFTVTGTNFSGAPLTETVTGSNATTVGTTQDFKTVSGVTHTGSVASTITIGTSGIGSSPWYMPDRHLTPMNLGIGVVVSGTINFTVEYTYDDPNAPYTGTFPTVFSISALASKTANTDSSMTTPIFAIRLTQNSFTNPGTAKMIVIQSGLGVQS
jgi:hypothetical protein